MRTKNILLSEINSVEYIVDRSVTVGVLLQKLY